MSITKETIGDTEMENTVTNWKNERRELYKVVKNAMSEMDKLKPVVVAAAYEIGGARALSMRMTLSNVYQLLNGLELNMREVSDEEADSDEYVRECDLYGM